jgi:type II secretory pathway component PulL
MCFSHLILKFAELINLLTKKLLQMKDYLTIDTKGLFNGVVVVVLGFIVASIIMEQYQAYKQRQQAAKLANQPAPAPAVNGGSTEAA